MIQRFSSENLEMEISNQDNKNEFISNNNTNSFDQINSAIQIKNQISSYMPGQYYQIPIETEDKNKNNENNNTNLENNKIKNNKEVIETEEITTKVDNINEKDENEKQIIDPDNEIFEGNKKNKLTIYEKEEELSDSNSIKKYLNLQSDEFKDQMFVQSSELKKIKNKKNNRIEFKWKVIFKGCILVREIYDSQNKNKYKKDFYLGQLKTNLETDW